MGTMLIYIMMLHEPCRPQTSTACGRMTGAVICWMCGVFAEDKVRSDSFENLGFDDLELRLCSHRLCCAGHGECSWEWGGYQTGGGLQFGAGEDLGGGFIFLWVGGEEDKEKLGLELVDASESRMWGVN